MTLNAGDIKRMNRQHIFELLIDYGRTTKTELAARSGLSIPTVYNIITEMEDRGLIERVEDVLQPMTPGRPRQYLRLNGDSRYAFGVRYEGELLCVGLVNLCGCMRAVRVHRCSMEISELFENVLPEIMEEMLYTSKVESGNVLGIGIGVAPEIAVEQGCVEALEVRMGLRVLMQQDIHFAVVGEFVSHRQRISNLIFVSMGTSVNCGVMTDGFVRKGRANQLGRIGSMVLEDGKTLDELIGRKALREKFGMPPEYDRARASAYAVRYLAMALHNLLLGCDVQTIVLGGDVAARLGEGVVDTVHAELKKLSCVPVRVQRQSCPTPAVLGAAFGIFYVTLDELIGTDE